MYTSVYTTVKFIFNMSRFCLQNTVRQSTKWHQLNRKAKCSIVLLCMIMYNKQLSVSVNITEKDKGDALQALWVVGIESHHVPTPF